MIDQSELEKKIHKAVFTATAADTAKVPGTDAQDPYGFLVEATQYAQAWLSRQEQSPGDLKPCAFVLSRALASEPNLASFSFMNAFRSRYDVELSGQLLLASENLAKVYGAPLDLATTSIYDAIAKAGYSGRTTLLFFPKESEVVVCPKGVGDFTCRHNIFGTVRSSLTQDEFDGLLDEFHTDWTKTPEAHLRPWKNQKEFIPIEDLELRIEGPLVYVLQMTLGYSNIQKEPQTSLGRIDIYVGPGVLQIPLGACVIELKVLRSRLPSGGKNGFTSVSQSDNEERAKEGIYQADDYRGRMRANLAYLCCFDARKDDENVPPSLGALANQKKVFLRRYYMHRSVPAARQAKIKVEANTPTSE